MSFKRLLLLSILLLVIVGCAATPKASSRSESSAATSSSAAESEKGAAQLWEENCNRCHNYRPANSYSDYQWTVVMHHMRVRANLTAIEQKQILDFLQSSN
jgi:nitrate/TMAO reductase-like tetraheme cytochrome c subunit